MSKMSWGIISGWLICIGSLCEPVAVEHCWGELMRPSSSAPLGILRACLYHVASWQRLLKPISLKQISPGFGAGEGGRVLRGSGLTYRSDAIS